MEDKCRLHIWNNIDRLTSETEYKPLLQKCVDNGILTLVMANNINNVPYEYDRTEDELQRERHRRLFRKLTKRGPTAYKHLKTILSELHYDEAVRLLNEVCNDESQFKSLSQRSQLDPRIPRVPIEEYEQPYQPSRLSNSNYEESGSKLELSKPKDQLEPYTDPIEPKTAHEVINAINIQVDPKMDIYPMDSQSNRGVFLMVNIIDFPNINQHRSGAEEDGKSLLHLFRNLGFTLFAYQNLTEQEFFTMLDKLLKSKYIRDTQCFVMALMTHGNIDRNSMQCVEFNDGKIVSVTQIESYFDNARCPNLENKPKILLFPFCRGDLPDYGTQVQTDGSSSRPNPVRVTHSMSDIMICYASPKGFKAHRDTTEGSWYIQKFCELMAKHAHDTNFEDIIKMVQAETAKLRTLYGAMQMGTYENRGFNKKLFFNPGIYWDEKTGVITKQSTNSS